MGEQGEVCGAEFAEAEAGVEEDVAWGDGGVCGLFQNGMQIIEDEGLDEFGIEVGEGVPGLWGAAGVHEDDAGGRVSGSEKGGHGAVPGKAADVVDDLGAGLHGGERGGAVVGVDGEDGVGAGGADGVEDGKEAGLLLGGRERLGVGAGGFRADIKDVGAAVEEVEAVFDGEVGGEELAGVREAVGGDIEDAHNEGALAQVEGAGAEAPGVPGARAEGHMEGC